MNARDKALILEAVDAVEKATKEAPGDDDTLLVLALIDTIRDTIKGKERP